MKVLFATPELAPWVKTGGLGDVAAALPAALRRQGLDVQVLLPCYPALRVAFSDAPTIAESGGLGGDFPAARVRAATAPDGTPLLLLDHPALFDRAGNPYLGTDGRDWPDNPLRFGFLSRVAAWLGSDTAPAALRFDIVHCNDWQTGLVPAYLHYLQPPGRCARTLITIHNLAFQGLFDRARLGPLGLPEASWSYDGVEYHGRLSFLKAGLQFADAITTVSPTYAREILGDADGMGMAGVLRHRVDCFSGILNGIDTGQWNPASDPLIAAHYGPRRLSSKRGNKQALQREFGLPERDDLPLFGIVSRLTEQKGLDLVPPLGAALATLPCQLAVLGSGDRLLESQFSDLARKHPDVVAVRLGFDEGIAHRIEAGADMFLMPSRFEPCGLNQMYSLRYGTPPIVRATGGLADTVIDCDADPDRGNGFVFSAPTPEGLLAAIQRAAAAWHDRTRWGKIQRRGMAADFGWEAPARRYAALYRALARTGDDV